MRDEEVRELRRELLEEPDSAMRTAFLRRLIPVVFRPHEPGSFGPAPAGVRDGQQAWILETKLFADGRDAALVVLEDGRIVPTPLSVLRLRKDFIP